MVMSTRPVLLLAVLLAWISSHGALAALPPEIHHGIDLSLDPATGNMKVRDTFQWAGRGPIKFRLAGWLKVTRASIDGQNREIRQQDGYWYVPGNGPPGREVTLTISGGLPPLNDQPGARAGNAGFSGRAGSYLPMAEPWIAYVDVPWIRFRLQVSVPAAYRAVATGRLISEETRDGRYTATFEADYPTEYPTVFAGEYVVNELMSDGVRLRTYFPERSVSLAEEYLRQAAAYIAQYSRRIGAYPYTEFHVIAAPIPVGLGFPGATYVSARILHLPFMRGRSLAHEIMHNWWGNAVGIDFMNGNWAEGLTTYLADYALAETQGPDAAREMRLRWLQSFAAVPPELDVPVLRFVSKTHDRAQAIGYSKVAFIFHMLRREIGDAAFDSGLREFWRANKFRIAGWRDLRAAFEKSAGSDLRWFFEQWINERGAPKVSLESAARTTENGQHLIAFELDQGGRVFRAHVPIVIETASGEVRKSVTMTARRQAFRIPVPSGAVSLRVDPDFNIFRLLLSGEAPTVFRDITLSSATVVAVPSKDKRVATTAAAIGHALLERDMTVISEPGQRAKDRPLLFIGTTSEYDAWRKLEGPGDAPDILARGTGRAWTQPAPNHPGMLIITANSAADLASLARLLPHYRHQSFLVFEGHKVIEKGVWQVTEGPLAYRFQE
ncbi:MAG: peptidase M1 [Rhodospirillales bacterium CG15_BIG_FIL_POST_REV_8_21_14_020_66_15]|nr:MAG: peptidase M1 [Rhodospirillales bacterium CG15_BIG_FIL_POST_REV_8_21_14_020_66_15]